MRRLALLVLWLAACSRPAPVDEQQVAPRASPDPTSPPAAPVPGDSSAAAPNAAIFHERVPELLEARQLCDALHLLPAQRRVACCPGHAEPPAQAAADTCAADLSAAIAGGGVVLDDERLTTCLETRERDLAGCAWVGPSPPPRPAACAAVVHGTLTAQSRCRSHHECAPNLRCAGLGPAVPGTCTPSTVEEIDPVDALARDLRDDVPIASSPPPGRCASDTDCPGKCQAGACVPRCEP